MQYFLSLSILRKDESECASLEVVELDEKDTASISNFYLNINQSKTDGDLSQVNAIVGIFEFRTRRY